MKQRGLISLFMKRAVSIILAIVLAAILYELAQLYFSNNKLKAEFSALGGKIENLKKENALLQADSEYFKDPANLEKELRARFNYKNPGEKMIIVVPPKSE